MKSHLLQWNPSSGWTRLPEHFGPVTLVLCFADRHLLTELGSQVVPELVAQCPGALVASCSTAGEISGSSVSDALASALVLSFSGTTVRGECIPVAPGADSALIGRELADRLRGPELRHVFILSDGLFVNGTRLADGLNKALPAGVSASGGLAGDGSRFQQTCVGLGTELGSRRVVGLGFYGSAFRVAFGSQGGWQAFGPKRLITRSEANVLYEVDRQPVLPLYKRYLGERASGLPATGLLFPLQLLSASDPEQGLVRTILAVDENAQSLTFAGDMPEGSFARLMKAGCDALVDGASQAADLVHMEPCDGQRAALLVSCVGRKLVMGQRVEEEVEAVLSHLGPDVLAAGFYSYGELGPSAAQGDCQLHNQTMTLTVIGEKA